MAKINWNATEIKLVLTPVGKPLGREPKRMSVFREYGDVKTRFVQTLANMIDGEVVYLDAMIGDDEVRGTVPVAGWRVAGTEPMLLNVTSFVESALSADMHIECYGASRARWVLDVKSETMAMDVTDNMSDKSTVAETADRSPIEPNGIRREF